MKSSLALVLSVVPLLLASPAVAAVRLGSPFRDGMVVQRDRPVRVWGWDEPGTAVTVTLAAGRATATAGPDGRWSAELPAVPAGPAGRMVAAGTTTAEVADVLGGEVWFCTGQSNMNFPLRKSAEWAEIERGGPVEGVRFLRAEIDAADAPKDFADATEIEWRPADPARVGNNSAVAYHFAVELHRKLGVPVGVIQASYGGTQIEAWLPAAAIGADPLAGEIRRRHEAYVAANAGEMDQRGIADRVRRDAPSAVYNAMVHPFEPFAVRGVVWYQGESNAARSDEYAGLFVRLLAAWRDGFDDADLPVVTTQLPNNERAWAAMREVQRRLADLPGVSMAVTIDVGDRDALHPTHKRPVGERLAGVALADVYGDADAPLSPTPATAARPAGKPGRSAGKPGRVVVTFDHAGEGLRSADGRAPLAFALAGAGGTLVPARATIASPTTVEVWSDAVPDPAEVAYAYANDPAVNLVGDADLPATPFRMKVADAKGAE